MGPSSDPPKCRGNKKAIGGISKRKKVYVGIDSHRDFLQVAIVDSKGKLLEEKRVENTPEDMEELLSMLPYGSRIAVESSSIWRDAYGRIKDAGFDVVLSNPFKTKAIAYSKVKTDKVDAKILADLLRIGMLPLCFVPSERTSYLRSLARHRKHFVDTRTHHKHLIHSILMMEGIRIDEATAFSKRYIKKLRDMKNYRIDAYLDMIEAATARIKGIDGRIGDEIEGPDGEDMRRLLTIPGVGPYTALVAVAEIADIGRFPDSHRLCAYAGIVPSVHSSGDTTYLGRITKRGSAHLRRAAIACVQGHRKAQPDSDLSRFYDRIQEKGAPQRQWRRPPPSCSA